jgi:hypothetical protein
MIIYFKIPVPVSRLWLFTAQCATAWDRVPLLDGIPDTARYTGRSALPGLRLEPLLQTQPPTGALQVADGPARPARGQPGPADRGRYLGAATGPVGGTGRRTAGGALLLRSMQRRRRGHEISAGGLWAHPKISGQASSAALGTTGALWPFPPSESSPPPLPPPMPGTLPAAISRVGRSRTQG